MSTQSCGRAANALCTMRSSAEHVRSVAPRTSSTFEDRSMALASKGIAPSATSTPNPSGVRSRSTRLRRANSAAPLIRLSNSASSAPVCPRRFHASILEVGCHAPEIHATQLRLTHSGEFHSGGAPLRHPQLLLDRSWWCHETSIASFPTSRLGAVLSLRMGGAGGLSGGIC